MVTQCYSPRRTCLDQTSLYFLILYKVVELQRIGNIVHGEKNEIVIGNRRQVCSVQMVCMRQLLQPLASMRSKQVQCTYMLTNISSAVEFQRWQGLKSKIFGQESTDSIEFFLKILSMNDSFTKSAKIVLSNSIFDVKNRQKFQLFFSQENINLGDHFLKKKMFFSRVKFWTILLLELCPIFNERADGIIFFFHVC